MVRFRFLGRGRLFQIESEFVEAASSGRAGASRKARLLRRVERYWLCDDCASALTLTFDQSRGIITVPLPDMPKQRILTALHLHELGPGARAGHGVRGLQ